MKGGRSTLRPYHWPLSLLSSSNNFRTHHGVSLQVMLSASLLLYREIRLEFIVTIFSRGCISGGYNEDTEILKLTEKGG